jgi:hypothetical protein
MSYLKKILLNIIRLVQSRAISYNLEEKKPRIGVYPYISGDAFLAISDIAFLRKKESEIKFGRNIQNKVIFYEAGLISTYKNKLIDGAVVIVHNGDNSLSEEDIFTLKKYNCRVFATNVTRQIGFIEPIPIGIENVHHRRNGSLHYYNPLNLANIATKKSGDVLVSFSINTNPIERSRVLKICKTYGFENEHMGLVKFRERLAECCFIISPPGNGIDCHRTWEAMYHKTVPVIEARYNLFKHVDLPILTVNSYSDFFNMSVNERFLIYQRIISRSYPAIYMDYWVGLIKKTCDEI